MNNKSNPGYIGLAKKVKEMRACQRNFRKTRITAWDYKAQRLECEVDEIIKQLGI